MSDPAGAQDEGPGRGRRVAAVGADTGPPLPASAGRTERLRGSAEHPGCHLLTAGGTARRELGEPRDGAALGDDGREGTQERFCSGKEARAALLGMRENGYNIVFP